MGSQEVKVLGAWFSPYGYMVELALKLKGIEYQLIEEDVTVNKSPLLLESNPVYKKIPVLIHNGKPLSESLIIVEYIDEVWNHNPILPVDLLDKATARFWATFIQVKLNEPLRNLVRAEDEKEKMVKEAIEALEIIEGNLLKGKNEKFFGGESIGYVDLVLSFMAIWLDVVEEACCVEIFEVQKFPLLDKWRQDFVEMPLIKETRPPRDKMVHFFTKFHQARLASRQN